MKGGEIEMAKASNEVKTLQAALEKCKDRNAPEARAIRRKLRTLGTYVGGQEPGEKVSKKKSKKKEKVIKKKKVVKKVKKSSKKKKASVDEEDD